MKNTAYYKSLYKNFIQSRQHRNIDEGGCYELHHIIPKSHGGTNVKTNLIYLTLKEHYFAHLLLAKAHPNSKAMTHAMLFMIGTMQYKTCSSRKFDLARKLATFPMPPKKELLHKYFSERKSMKELGKEYNVSDMTICKWFKVYKIKAYTPVEITKQKKFIKPPKEQFQRDYERAFHNNCTKDLTNKYNVSRSTISKWINEYKIKIEVKRPSINELAKIYKEYGLIQGAKYFKVHRTCFRRWLKDADLYTPKPYRHRGDILTTAEPIPNLG